MALRFFRAESAKARTLQLHMPTGQALAFAVLVLVAYLVLGEVAIRYLGGRIALGTPGLGSDHKQFEQQWFRLEEYVARRQVVDCIFVGDSTAMTDFSPAAFTRSYGRQAGEDLDCYNYGVGAFTAVGLAALSQILVQEYSPRLLLVGVEALNFTVPLEKQGEADLASTAWARYKLGDFMAEGWLYENVHLYRYLGVFRQLLTATINRSEVMQSAAGEIGGVKDGFFPMTGTGPFDVSQPPNPEFDHPYIEHYFAAMEDFALLPENLDALETILSLNGTTKIILVEMPVPDTFHTFFGNDRQDYKMFADSVASQADSHSVPFLRVQDQRLLPAQVWFNYNHLNSDGAPIFSSWLGERLAQVPAAILGQVN
jgi:hypothetical protein